MALADIVDLETWPIADPAFRQSCKKKFDESGAFAMPGFVKADAIASIKAEGEAHKDKAFFTKDDHTVYLDPVDPAYPVDHPRNRMVVSSKGCITDDVVPADSLLRALYNDPVFQTFLCEVLGEEALYEYADPLSSINIHYADRGQELGWHFDNSSFAITLMIQPPAAGGAFEYVPAVRDADAGDMNFDMVGAVLDGDVPVKELRMNAGALVFFRGRNAIHRVAPNEGDQTRMLAVLAYNSEPGISLSEEARMTFYGKIA